MTALLTQALQSLLNPIAKPIRNEFSNLALRLLVAIVFSTLAIFSGLNAIQALQAELQELIFGAQIEIAVFSVLLLTCLGIVFAVLRRKPKPVVKELDFNALFQQFLNGAIEGMAAENLKKEAAVKAVAIQRDVKKETPQEAEILARI
jgi:hypothetical protein